MLDEIKEYEQYTMEQVLNQTVASINERECRLKRLTLIKGNFSGLTRALTIIARKHIFEPKANNTVINNGLNAEVEDQVKDVLRAWCELATKQNKVKEEHPELEHWLDNYIRKAFLYKDLLDFLPVLKKSREKEHLQAKLAELESIKASIVAKRRRINEKKLEEAINNQNGQLKDAIIIDKISHIFPAIDFTSVKDVKQETINLDTELTEFENNYDSILIKIKDNEEDLATSEKEKKEIAELIKNYDPAASNAMTITELRKSKKVLIGQIKRLSEEKKDYKEKRRLLKTQIDELKKEIKATKKKTPKEMEEAFNKICSSVLVSLKDLKVLGEKKEKLADLKNEFDTIITNTDIFKKFDASKKELNQLKKKYKKSESGIEAIKAAEEKVKELATQKEEYDLTVFDSDTLGQLMTRLNAVKQCIDALINLSNRTISYNKRMFSASFSDPPAFKSITFEKIIVNAFYMGKLEQYVLACKSNPFLINNNAEMPTVKRFTEKTATGHVLSNSDKDLLLKITAYYLLQKRFTDQAYVVFNQSDMANWLWNKANSEKFQLNIYKILETNKDNKDNVQSTVNIDYDAEIPTICREPLFNLITIGADKDNDKKGLSLTKIRLHDNWLKKFQLIKLEDIDKPENQQFMYFSDIGTNCYLQENNNKGRPIYEAKRTAMVTL